MEYVLTKISENKIQSLLLTINKTKDVLKELKEIGSENSNIVRLNNIQAKSLSEKNIEKLNDLNKLIKDPTLNKMLEVMNTNFEITDHNFNILRAYTDEYFHRFYNIEIALTELLNQLEGIANEYRSN